MRIKTLTATLTALVLACSLQAKGIGDVLQFKINSNDGFYRPGETVQVKTIVSEVPDIEYDIKLIGNGVEIKPLVKIRTYLQIGTSVIFENNSLPAGSYYVEVANPDDGKDIKLNDTMTISVEEYPDLKAQVGKTLMVADGTTLLGADDKAGIVAALEAVQYLIDHPEIPHGDIAVGFTPDEEIGNGPKYFDIEGFGCDFAYTMDGGAVDGLCYETFNAATGKVDIKGFSIHPGTAKGKMINAAAIACEFEGLTPKQMRPEFTSGREGFIHLTSMSGDCDHAEMTYILRDHDAQKLEEQKVIMRAIESYLNAEYGQGVVTVTITDVYRNMREVFNTQPEALEIAAEALKALGLTPVEDPARGGTDGATLSLKGLPCPNLGCGGRNFHGPYEYCVMEELDKSVELILKVIELVAKNA